MPHTAPASELTPKALHDGNASGERSDPELVIKRAMSMIAPKVANTRVQPNTPNEFRNSRLKKNDRMACSCRVAVSLHITIGTGFSG